MDPFLTGPDPFAAAESLVGVPGGNDLAAADLDIEDRSGSHRSPASESPAAAFGLPFEPATPGREGETLALATEPTPAAATPAAPPRDPEAGSRPAPRRSPDRAAAAPAPASAGSPPHAQAGLRGVRTAAVNALSLVALLSLALAFRLVWRGEVTLADAFRPAALVAALGAHPASAGSFTIRDVTAAVYPQASGAGLLYVRGEVSPGPGAPAGPLRLHIELLRGGRVLASAEGRAGAVPSPEELHAAVDRAAIDRLAAELEARPAATRTGALPFLVPVPDAPSDLTGTEVRVDVLQAGGQRP